MLKRALLVGIDDYDQFSCLGGCVNDVAALYPLLRRNDDSIINFDCQVLTSDKSRIERETLIESIEALLAPGADVALFYFAGHGDRVSNGTDVALVAQNATQREPGITLSSVLAQVATSSVKEVIIILDCCFSGAAGGIPQIGGNNVVLKQGLSILTASRGDQVSAETPDGRGLFSTYLCGALDNGAADTLGKVNLAGIYAYLTESFGAWDQRPTFKANVDGLHDLRKCKPAVPYEQLLRLVDIFMDSDYILPLDSTYEPEAEPQHPEHQEIFAILQRCRAAKLVEPVGHEHMWHAAMFNLGCRLTPLGKHYWTMIKTGQL
jgi:hypothetical protein